MVVGEIAEDHDLLIVGGGPGGYAAALRGSQLGRDVTLVDTDGAEGVGGTCLRVGCIPSKALIEVANQVAQLEHLARIGIVETGLTIDLGAFQSERERIVERLTAGIRHLLDQANVTILEGRLRFQRPGQALIAKEGQPLKYVGYRDAVIATGSRPLSLPSLPFDHQRVLDSSDVLSLAEVPRAIVVVGGGYIGLELGTALAKLGSSVTIVEAMDRLLPTMAPTIARAVASRLDELGVEVYTGSRLTSLEGESATLDQAGESRTLDAPLILVAVGRRANTDDLGLESLDVAPSDRGLLLVGADRLVAPNVAAIGDITPGPALAHKAMAEAVVAVENLCGGSAAFEPAAIPAVVFSDPEVAVAGYSLEEAEEAGIPVEIATFPVAASGRAMTLGTARGHASLILDAETRAVLGIEIVGPHASELIAEGTLAIELAALDEDVAATIHPHPTMTELVGEAAQIAIGRPLHSNRVADQHGAHQIHDRQ